MPHRIDALEQVANRAILSHALDELRGAGVNDVIITGDSDTLIEVQSFLRTCDTDAQGIAYSVRRGDTSLSSMIEAVAPLVRDSACVIQPGDGLLEAPIRSLLERIDDRDAEPIIFTAANQTATNGRRPLRVAGSAAENAWNDLALFGPGAMLEWLEASVQVQEISGWYRYNGNRQELLELNRVALNRLIPRVPEDLGCSNRFEGALDIDPTASIRDSVIVGPAAIGPGAIVHDAYIGPWTSIGAHARVDGAEIERSIVSPGASIAHVGGRLMASLVGRDARIYKDFSLPRVMRLWVGDGDEVALC